MAIASKEPNIIDYDVSDYFVNVKIILFGDSLVTTTANSISITTAYHTVYINTEPYPLHA